MHRLLFLNCLLGFAVLSGGGSAVAQEISLPPHPTLLSAAYKGKQLPVVAVAENKPIVLVDGKRKVLAADTPLQTERAAAYPPGRVEITGGVVKRTPIVLMDFGRHQTKAEELTCELTLTSTEDAPDCYLVLITFDADSLTNPAITDSSAITVRNVGTLRANEPKQFSFKSQIIFPERYAEKSPAVAVEWITMNMVWQVFSGGAELRANVPGAVSAFYHHREASVHRLAVEGWRKTHSTGNHPARAILQIPPLLDSIAGLPQPASATLYLTEDGTVASVAFDQEFPEAAREPLTTTLRAWLFLPAIKNGQTVPTRVRVPLAF